MGFWLILLSASLSLFSLFHSILGMRRDRRRRALQKELALHVLNHGLETREGVDHAMELCKRIDKASASDLLEILMKNP